MSENLNKNNIEVCSSCGAELKRTENKSFTFCSQCGTRHDFEEPAEKKEEISENESEVINNNVVKSIYQREKNGDNEKRNTIKDFFFGNKKRMILFLGAILALILVVSVVCGVMMGNKNSEITDLNSIYVYKLDSNYYYKAEFISKDTINIGKWYDYYSMEDKFICDILTARIDDPDVNFKWTDDTHNSFSIMIIDEKETNYRSGKVIIFHNTESIVKSLLYVVETTKADTTKSETIIPETTKEETKKPETQKPSEGSGTTFEKYDVTYQLNDGKLTAISYNGSGDSITIPSEIDGYKVTAFGDSVFENCTSFKTIIIWADIESFGNSSFKGCSSLESISISSKTTYIGPHAFEGCTSLESAIVWGNPSFEEYSFKGCTSLESINISSKTDHVGAHAFEGCTSLDSVTIWGLNTIDEYAFAGCTAIDYISFPNDLKKIGSHAFDGCSNLEDVIVWGKDTIIEADAFVNCPKLTETPSY